MHTDDARQANADFFDTIKRANIGLYAQGPPDREVPMYVCPTCAAQSGQGPPHGSGVSCPTAVKLAEATISEKEAHTELLKAQTVATELNIRSSR